MSGIESAEAKVVERWRRHPRLFVLEAIGCQPTNQQSEALDLVGELAEAKIVVNKGWKATKRQKELAEKIGISIRSGHGTGKDALISWVNLWLIFCFPEPRGIVTAPTDSQLSSVLWPETRKWLRASKAELWRHIDIQSDKLYLKGRKGDWFFFRRTAKVRGSEEEQGEALAGLHADYMISEVDEASGCPDGVFKPFEGAQTGLMNFGIIIGNMTRSSGYFYNSHFTSAGRFWVKLHWDCEKSNLDEVTGTKSMSTYVQRMADKYGRDSNFFRIRVKGEPPRADPDSLIPFEWVQAAAEREVVPEEYDPVLMGSDCGAGMDKSANLWRKGMKVYPINEYNTRDTMELVGWICRDSVDCEADAIFVDVIGIGNGVFNRLRELRYPAFAVNVANKARSDEKFFRLRDELFWRVREVFEKGIIDIPPDDELIGELSSIKYSYDSGGKIKIESKMDMKRRGLHSPNKADALALTFNLPDYVFAKKKAKDPYDEEDEQKRDVTWMAA